MFGSVPFRPIRPGEEGLGVGTFEKTSGSTPRRRHSNPAPLAPLMFGRKSRCRGHQVHRAPLVQMGHQERMGLLESRVPRETLACKVNRVSPERRAFRAYRG